MQLVGLRSRGRIVAVDEVVSARFVDTVAEATIDDTGDADLARARGGDNDAFARLVAPLRGELRAHCYRMLGSVDDADDVLQDALLRAWRGLPRFAGRSSLRTWLYTVATRACLDQVKVRRKRALPMDLGGASRHVGTVVHAVLRQIAAEGLAAWTGPRIATLESLLEAELSRLGVDSSSLAKAVEQASRAIRNTLSSERGAWILRARAGACSERPIGGILDGKLIAGTIDRMFQDDENRLWIIDFKTSSHAGGQLDAFLQNEQRRYREQMESYGRLMQQLVPGPISLGLYFPLLDAWREWELAGAAEVLAAGSRPSKIH